MQIAITAAGFTPAEADGLRRAMATFRHVGSIGGFRGQVRRRHDPRATRRTSPSAAFRADPRLLHLRFPESHAASFALHVYASAWMKCRHPTSSWPRSSTPSPWASTSPPSWCATPAPTGSRCGASASTPATGTAPLEPAGNPALHAVRIGLRVVRGLPEAAMRRLVRLRANGYASIEGLQAALALPRNTLERLAEADAFRSLGLDRRAALWMVRTLEGTSARKAAKADPSARRAHLLDAPLPLFAWHADDGLFRHEPAVDLPSLAPSEAVAEDYAATGLSLQGHPVAFFRGRLARIGAIRPGRISIPPCPRGRGSRWRASC